MAHVAFPPTAASGAAAGSGFKGLFSQVFLRIELALQVRRERRQLQALGDAGLKDIGLSRSHVFAEAHRSFWDLPVDRLR